jgi:GTP-binding protein EngB required for normal cell division
LAESIIRRYGISATSGLLETCRNVANDGDVTVAVLGRFKAGKSSFLNHFLGRDLLPVGVIPVTSVVTEIMYGPVEAAMVQFIDGRAAQVPVEAVRQYIAESENPENFQQVRSVVIQLPELSKFRGLRFVDTPGLDSALVHNTKAALDWLPNVGLALLAVSVDPPLSEQDVALIQSLYKFTPNVSLLITKTDLLSPQQTSEVLDFIRQQLAKRIPKPPVVLPYSTRPGFESLRSGVENVLLNDTIGTLGERREQILRRKTDTLLRECADFLLLALKAAEAADTERETLRRVVEVERDAIADLKSEFRLVVRHTAGGIRAQFAAIFERSRSSVETRLTDKLRVTFPQWSTTLAKALAAYEEWLRVELEQELSQLSMLLRPEFISPLTKTSKQVQRLLQTYRDQLSDHTERAFGVPLRTTEADIEPESPREPDIRIGHVFDRNWELLSPVLPMAVIKRLVYGHFQRKLPFMVEKNFSRATTQWADAVTGALTLLEKEADRRLDELIGTVDHLLSTNPRRAEEIRKDVARIDRCREELGDVEVRNAT